MSSAARQHDAVDGVHSASPDATVAPSSTEYVTRGARAHRGARPHLRIVSPLRAERASRGVFALVVLTVLTVGMLAVLLINTSLAQGAFTVSQLKSEQTQLRQQEQTLTEAVAALGAPESLEARARGLGMVPSENPVFLDLTTGKVLGEAKPAPGTRSAMPRLLTPADATVSEGVDSGLGGLPMVPPAEVDPATVDAAAVDAAAAQAARNSQDAGESAAAAKKVKNPNAENNLWEEATILDVTDELLSTDAGLMAVPVP